MGSKLIFLTSTVSPRTIKCSGNADERRIEYLKAIHFYLKHTKCNILIVDNSGYDFSKDINHDRFESLQYVGDEGDEAFGKGYCETKILMYGFANSRFIKTSNQVVKITGRHIVRNINLIMAQARDIECVYANSDIKFEYTHSYVFIAPKSFMKDYLFDNIHLMDDSNNMHFEHILGKSIIDYLNDKGKFEEFILPLYMIGHPGGSNNYYAKPLIKRHFIIFTKFLIVKLRTLLR